MTAAQEFTEFAAGAAPRLLRTAFLLCVSSMAGTVTPVQVASCPENR